jgi:hypothetical protein
LEAERAAGVLLFIFLYCIDVWGFGAFGPGGHGGPLIMKDGVEVREVIN